MPAPYEPTEGDAGLIVGGSYVPSTQPLAYTPCKNELGMVVGGAFIPFDSQLKYNYRDPNEESFPQLVTAVPIDRDPPYVQQTTMAVASPAVIPYSWTPTNPSGGGWQTGNVDNTKSRRTVICDTTPDAIATAAEKALPGYVANPGLRMLSQTHWDFMTAATTASVSAGHFVYGETYKILSVGNTDFTNIGATANTVGTVFTATGPGVGSGTAVLNDVDVDASALKAGVAYEIKTPGTTDFTLVGAADNVVGTTFWATGPGQGTGVATRLTYAYNDSDGIGYIWDFMPAVAQFIWTKTSPTSGTWQIKTPNTTDVILWGYNSPPVTPYVKGGYEISSPTSTTTSVWFTVNGGSRYLVYVTYTYANGFAPASFDYHVTADGNRATDAINIVEDVWYSIYQPGTTNWVAIGAANNNSGTYFKATGPGTGTGNARRVEPHPLLKTGQTRYPVQPEKVGTDYDGTPFVPTPSVTGILRLCAYRYGLILSLIGDYYNSYTTEVWVRMKIGKATASWNKSAKELTLYGDQDYGFLYSTNGTTPTTEYTVPISVLPTATAGSFLVGATYKIKTVGSTNFMKIGAADNDVGTVFISTGVGTGSGTADLQSVTVTWKATRGCMEDSDTWTTTVTCLEYEDPNTHVKTWVGPDNFSASCFSVTPPTYPNSPVNARLQFQRKPDWYISPNGSGTGKTPDSPSNALTVIGTPTIHGLAWGSRRIDMSWDNTTKKFSLTQTAYNYLPGHPGSPTTVIKYKLAAVADDFPAGWTTYSAPVSVTEPSKALFKLVMDDGTDFTRNFQQPLPVGDSHVHAVWNKTLQTLTLSCDYADTELWYADNTTSTPTTKYTAPIYMPIAAGSFVTGTQYKIYTTGTTDFTLVGAADSNVGTVFTATGPGAGTGEATKTGAVTYAVTAYHINNNQPWDFTTLTTKVNVNAITPDSTADFNQQMNVTFVRPSFGTLYSIAQAYHVQQEDVVWCSEGVYENPTGVASQYFYSGELTVKGGYNSDFTERDVMNRKTIWMAKTWAGGTDTNTYSLYIPSGIIDGCWTDNEVYTNGTQSGMSVGLSAPTMNNCHVDMTYDFPGTIVGLSFLNQYAYRGNTNCSIRLRLTGATNYDLAVNASANNTNCDYDIEVTAASGGSNRESAIYCRAYGGPGCNSRAVLVSGNGGPGTGVVGPRSQCTYDTGGTTNSNCTIDVSCTSGNGGMGTTYRGQSGAGVNIYGTSPVTCKMRATSGSGGTAGAYATFTNYYSSLIQINTGVDIDAVVVSGNATTAGNPSEANVGMYYNISNAPYAAWYRPKLTGSATCGSGTNSRAFLTWATAPAYILPGDVTFTENTPFGNGNPVRPNAVPSYSMGWYGGTPQSDGAPLGAPWDTAHGTGVVLGRYWE